MLVNITVLEVLNVGLKHLLLVLIPGKLDRLANVIDTLLHKTFKICSSDRQFLSIFLISLKISSLRRISLTRANSHLVLIISCLDESRIQR